MDLRVDPSSREPIHRQLVQQLRAAIAQGRLRPGERLPAAGELATELVVNPQTVARAYEELRRERLLDDDSLPRVAPIGHGPAEGRAERLAVAVDSLLVEAVLLGATPAEVKSVLAERLVGYHWRETGVGEAPCPTRSSPTG